MRSYVTIVGACPAQTGATGWFAGKALRYALAFLQYSLDGRQYSLDGRAEVL